MARLTNWFVFATARDRNVSEAATRQFADECAMFVIANLLTDEDKISRKLSSHAIYQRADIARELDRNTMQRANKNAFGTLVGIVMVAFLAGAL